MGVTRTELSFEGQFTQVPNEWARDARLSRRARGLLVEIMSHRVGWRVTISTLQSAGREGRDAIRSALDELKECGYLRLAQGRGELGRFNEVEYELCDPGTAVGKSDTGGFTAVGFPDVGSADIGESDTKKTISTEDQSSEHHLVEAAAALSPEDEAFERVWAAWPSHRRGTRKKSGSSFRSAVRAVGGVRSVGVLVAAVETFTSVWASWPAAEQQYVPGLATWLNQERWTEEPPRPRGGRMSTVDQGRAAHEILLQRERAAAGQRAVSA